MDICRYMSLQRFCEILFNQELVLVPPSWWNDKYENYLHQALKTPKGEKVFLDYLKAHTDIGKDTSIRVKLLKELISNSDAETRCLCFSKNIDDETMWSAYNYNNETIMLKTDTKRLISLDSLAVVREVEYDLEDMGLESYCKLLSVGPKGTKKAGISDYFQLFLHKRKCFEYENEIRIMKSVRRYKDGELERIPISDLSDFITGIMVHPLASDNYTKLIEKMCEKFGVAFLGKSKIYELTEIY